ncbi:MAG: gluconate kinase [Desulfobacteraceae bacterium]|nr:MAG: gluconate kinase [Desulfobacteraceae bacterium]
MIGIKSDPWFLGIDLGTGSCKSVAVDQHGSILGFGSGEYPSDSVQSRWKEQDPEAMLSGMIGSVRAAVESAGVSGSYCAGMSIGSALHGILAVDRSGRPLTGVMTWADDRASCQAGAAKETDAARSLYAETGCPIHWMYPLYKILWVKENHPETFHLAERFLSAKEYITHKLIREYVIDYSLAAGSGLLNTHSLDWSDTAMKFVEIDRSRLSRLCAPGECFTGISSELAGAMGIPPATPFVLGSSDAANSNLGAGAVSSWQSTCMIGTSGALRIFSSRPVLDPKARSWCYAVDKGRWLVGGAINNGGVAFSWLQELFNSASSITGKGARLEFKDLIRIAEGAGVGSNGLICLPFFAGERSPNWNLNARAMFFGLNLQHDARHTARALLEGVAFRMRSLHEVLGELSGDIRQVRASGGFTRSPLWLQIVSDVLDRELAVPSWGETSSLGAAFWALLGTGVLATFEQAEKLVKLDCSYRPEAANTAVYNRLFEIYQNVYDAMSRFFEPIAEVQKHLERKG